MEVEPRESICTRIDSSFAELRFKLQPSKTGDFSVGADVELYSSGDGTRAASHSLLELLSRAWTALLGACLVGLDLRARIEG